MAYILSKKIRTRKVIEAQARNSSSAMYSVQLVLQVEFVIFHISLATFLMLPQKPSNRQLTDLSEDNTFALTGIVFTKTQQSHSNFQGVIITPVVALL